MLDSQDVIFVFVIFVLIDIEVMLRSVSFFTACSCFDDVIGRQASSAMWCLPGFCLEKALACKCHPMSPMSPI